MEGTAAESKGRKNSVLKGCGMMKRLRKGVKSSSCLT